MQTSGPKSSVLITTRPRSSWMMTWNFALTLKQVNGWMVRNWRDQVQKRFSSFQQICLKFKMQLARVICGVRRSLCRSERSRWALENFKSIRRKTRRCWKRTMPSDARMKYSLTWSLKCIPNSSCKRIWKARQTKKMAKSRTRTRHSFNSLSNRNISFCCKKRLINSYYFC